MNINIQINDKDVANGTAVASVATADVPHQDGGVSKAGTDGSASSSVASTLHDIGAPPQWLYDAIGTKQAGNTAAAQNTGGDGGEAPSF